MVLEDIIYYGPEAMKKLRIGVDKVAKAVACTMGPSGRSVILGGSDGLPIVTKDGVSVANYVVLVDPIENMGAELVKQAAANTVKDSGDGTTTATVLTHKFVHEFTDLKYSTSFKRGVESAKDLILESLKVRYSKVCDTVEELTSITMTATNNDTELATLIAEAVHKAGVDGSVEIQMTNQKDISTVTYDGYKMNSGWMSSYFINNSAEASSEIKDSYVLLIDGKLEHYRDLQKLLKHARGDGKALVVIAEDFSEEIQMACIKNYQNGWHLIPIKSENFGEYQKATIEDLAAYTDGKLYLPSDLSTKGELPQVVLGSCSSVTLYKDHTILTQGLDCSDSRLTDRVKLVKTLIEKAENNFDKSKLNVRLNQLSGGYSKINIGGFTESSIKERFDRAEDAIGSAQAALKDGVLPGGGNPLWKIGNQFSEFIGKEDDDFLNGWRSVMKGIQAPLNQLIANTGSDLDSSLEKLSIEQDFYGLDENLHNVDLIEKGIIDPFSVTKSALNNSISVALLIASVGATLQSTFKQI